MPRARPPRRRAALLGAASALALAVAGCTTSPMPAPTPTPGKTVAPSGDGVLRIGTLFPTRGSSAALGAAQIAGVNAAVREINATGGVLGAPVDVVNRDSGDASSEMAEASFAALVEKGVDVVIGPSSSVLVERLLPLAIEAGVPLISPAATSVLTGAEADGFFARTVPAYPLQGTALGELLTSEGADRVALIVGSDEDSMSIIAPLTDALAESGGELVATVTATNPADAASAVAAVSKEKPDAVVLATADDGEATRSLVSGLVEEGYGGERLWLTSRNLVDYGQALAVGVLEKANGIREGVRPDDAFIAKLRVEDPGLSETRYAAEAYDATVIAALAAIVARDDGGPSIAWNLGGVTREGIPCTSFGACVDVLASEPDIAYAGIVGALRLDAAGDPTVARYEVYRYGADNTAGYAASVGG